MGVVWYGEGRFVDGCGELRLGLLMSVMVR